MIKISKDNRVLEVTKGVYESLYKGMGFVVVTDTPKKDFVEAKVIEETNDKNNETETAENKEQEEVKRDERRSNRK